MTSAQVVETSVTNNFSELRSPADDHTIRTADTPGFKPFTMKHDFSLTVTVVSVTNLWAFTVVKWSLQEIPGSWLVFSCRKLCKAYEEEQF